MKFNFLLSAVFTLCFSLSAQEMCSAEAEAAGNHIRKVIESEFSKAYSQENYSSSIDDSYGLIHYVVKIKRVNNEPATFTVKSNNQDLKAYFDRFKYYIVRYKE